MQARAWDAAIRYTLAVIAAKFLFQLPIFCLQVSSLMKL
jgi:hypothetical protein